MSGSLITRGGATPPGHALRTTFPARYDDEGAAIGLLQHVKLRPPVLAAPGANAGVTRVDVRPLPAML